MIQRDFWRESWGKVFLAPGVNPNGKGIKHGRIELKGFLVLIRHWNQKLPCQKPKITLHIYSMYNSDIIHMLRNIMKYNAHAVYGVDEWIVAAVAHGKPVAEEEQDVDVMEPERG